MKLYTIGGMAPVPAPVKEHGHGLGHAVTGMTSENIDIRNKSYFELMNTRRYFTIEQWATFVNELDAFRKNKGMVTLSEMLVTISQDLIKGRVSGHKQTNRKEDVMSSTKQIVEGLALVTESLAKLTAEIANLVPEESNAEIAVDPVAKTAKSSAKAAKPAEKVKKAEPEVDLRKECSLQVATIIKYPSIDGGDTPMNGVRKILADHGLKGIKSAPEESIPELLKALTALADEVQALNG